jgi:dihydroorotase
MITIKNVKTLDGQVTDYIIPSLKDQTIEARDKLLLLPGVIDPHICFGSIDRGKQSWDLAVESAIRGGITTVIELPSPNTPCNDKVSLNQKSQTIDKRLADLKITLPYLLYAHADLEKLDELGPAKKLMKGVVIQLNPDKKEELDDRWDRVFQLCGWEDIPIIVNSCNENTRKEFKRQGQQQTLLEKAIHLTEKHSTRLYVLNVSTQQEIELIQAARDKSLLVYAETTPQHLFQNDSSKADCLWKSINQGVIETIGSGYNASDQTQEKILFRGSHFSHCDPIFLLPNLLTAYLDKKISIEKLVHLIRLNIRDILEIAESRDVVLVDLEGEQIIRKISNGHSVDVKLRGWPVHTIIHGHIFSSFESSPG